MQLASQILAFGRICYAIKQYMQLSNINSTILLLNGWNWEVVTFLLIVIISLGTHSTYSLLYWFKHILFRRKGLGAAYNATMTSVLY